MKKKAVLALGMLIVSIIFIYAAGNLQRNLYNKYSAGISKDINNISVEQETISKDNESKENIQANTKDTSETENNNVALKEDKIDSKSEESKAEIKDSPSSENAAGNKTNNTVEVTDNKSNRETSSDNNTDKNPSNAGSSNENKLVEEKPNLFIVDTINNRTIISTKAIFDGRTLSEILSEVLDKALKENKIKSYSLSNIRYIMNNGTVTQDTKWRGTLGYISDIDGLLEKKPIASSGWIYYRNGEKVPFGIGDPITKTFKDNDIITIKFYKDALNEK